MLYKMQMCLHRAQQIRESGSDIETEAAEVKGLLRGNLGGRLTSQSSEELRGLE